MTKCTVLILGICFWSSAFAGPRFVIEDHILQASFVTEDHILFFNDFIIEDDVLDPIIIEDDILDPFIIEDDVLDPIIIEDDVIFPRLLWGQFILLPEPL